MDIAIPYGGYWCTPFARWQGSLAHLHSLKFAAHVAREALAARGIAPTVFDHGVLGITVPQKNSFYGLPWLAGEIGAGQIGGPTIMQACATSARVLAEAAREIAAGSASCGLTITADRVSNGPHVYYPNPPGPGGTGETEDWVLGNFECDPFAQCNMVTTAENCARQWQVSTAEQHDLVLMRYAQYQAAFALTNGHSFQQRYMPLPFAVPDQRFTNTVATLSSDEGIHPTTAEGLQKLKAVTPNGTITYGAQTHPADGNAGMIVTTPARAAALSREPGINIRVLAFAQARAALAMMPAAPIEAAQRALVAANLKMADLAAIKSHNPFAVNDSIFARATGAKVEAMNNYGCSLIWGIRKRRRACGR